jgi:hypothetical protein
LNSENEARSRRNLEQRGEVKDLRKKEDILTNGITIPVRLDKLDPELPFTLFFDASNEIGIGGVLSIP